MKIAVDAMGGDFGPAVVVEGAVAACREFGLPSVLVGFAVLRFLTDYPRDAGWLEPEQRGWLVDRMDASASAIDSVNTIVNDDGVLTAYNTDYSAIAQLIERNGLQPSASVLLQGSGGMAKATAAAFRDAGFGDVTIVARNEERGLALAELYGFSWRPTAGDAAAEVIVNVTPIGMAGGADADRLSFSPEAVEAASVVFDVVALPNMA